jgi:IclR family transcriptional regulator, KDG regulon repressor
MAETSEKSAYSSSVPAVDQAARILLYLARSNTRAVNLTDICAALGVHKSKGYSILNTLMQYGFVERHPVSKLYSLGPGLIGLGRRTLDTLDMRELLSPILGELVLDTGASAFYGIVSDGDLFIVARHESEQAMPVTLRIGHRFPLTAGAHGKAIVAFMEEEERAALLKGRKLFFHGDPERLDRKRLRTELRHCRRDGFAFDVGELNPGLSAIASPVIGAADKPVGALLVVGTFPHSRVEHLGRIVTQKAKDVSRMLGADVKKDFAAL